MSYRDPVDAAAARSETLQAELARVEGALVDREELVRERNRLRTELVRTGTWLAETRRKRHLEMVERVARVEVATPCEERWEHMHGDERKRRCRACDRDVYDLTAHTLEEVDALLSRPEQPCIQFYRRMDGTILTKDCGPVPKRAELGLPPNIAELAGALAGAGTIALFAGAAAVVMLPQLGRRTAESQTRADAQEVRSAVLLYMGQEAGADCPTMAELQEAGVLDSGRRTTDAWDRPFLVECNGDDITVISTGPDRAKRTADDIR
jgi:general secretion pathway protein G